MNLFALRAWLICILISVPLSVLGTTPPPVEPFDAITWKATMKRNPLTELRMGVFRVRFEKTTLDDVRRVAGVGEISHRGDAGASTYWLCFTSLGPKHAERIWIVAHGEMGDVNISSPTSKPI
jgi:hypothetical protein